MHMVLEVGTPYAGSYLRTLNDVLGPELMFAEYDTHYPSRSGQTSLATALANITKPVTKNNFGPSMQNQVP